MLAACAKGRALMGGTEAMRRAGKVYLPQFAAEAEDAYNARLKASWLFNGLRKTVRDMTGRVFAKSVEVTDAPPDIEVWTENVDMQGQDLSMFANRVFADALSGPGIAWIMVDAPPRAAAVTVTQAVEQNLRPYMVHLSIEEVLGWKAETVNNVMTVTQLRLHETVSEPDPLDPFATKPVEQIRVLTRTDAGVETVIYRKAGTTDEWVAGEATYSAMTEITVAPVYLNRCGFWMGEPPLDDLADVNIAHWQSQSDQRNILHVARVPILHATGRSNDDPVITVGASHAVASMDPAAKLEWVEHSGQAIGAGRQDLKDLEYQMEALGLQLLAPKGQQSATGEAIDNAKETSQLTMMADALQDALEQAVRWMGAYAGLDASAARVVVNKEFGVTMMTAQEVTALHTSVQAGNLSRQTFIGELARRGVIAPDIDPEAEIDRINSEGPRMTGQPMDLNGTGSGRV